MCSSISRLGPKSNLPTEWMYIIVDHFYTSFDKNNMK